MTKFLENLSDICEPIRKLTHKENVWNWTFEQDEAFKKLNEAVPKTPVLKYAAIFSESGFTPSAVNK
jgi:hypothetical protein